MSKFVDWEDYETGATIYSLQDIPANAIGFVYLITYVDNMCYIGKKNLYVKRTTPVLKSGKPRPNTIDRTYKLIGGHRKYYDIVLKESNWKTYNGSHKEAKIRIPKTKVILQYAYTNLQLTYLEAKWLFACSVLERTDFINDNILGKFYRNVNSPA